MLDECRYKCLPQLCVSTASLKCMCSLTVCFKRARHCCGERLSSRGLTSGARLRLPMGEPWPSGEGLGGRAGRGARSALCWRGGCARTRKHVCMWG
eukprot:6193817-Pleurochrysis_carterae.AAC.1